MDLFNMTSISLSAIYPFSNSANLNGFQPSSEVARVAAVAEVAEVAEVGEVDNLVG